MNLVRTLVGIEEAEEDELLWVPHYGQSAFAMLLSESSNMTVKPTTRCVTRCVARCVARCVTLCVARCVTRCVTRCVARCVIIAL